jgi:beta-glucosidase
MSDWLATHSGLASIEAGLDMNIPGGIDFPDPTPSFWGDNVTVSVNNGSLLEERVDDMVLRIMTLYFYLGQDADFPPIDGYTPRLGFFGSSGYPHNFTLGPTVDVRYRKHSNLIRDLGAAGTVLLKNTNGALPLKAPKTIGVFGNDAADLTKGQYSLATMGLNLADGDYDIGTLAVVRGSGTGRFAYVVSPLEAIKARGQSHRAIVQYITDNKYIIEGGLASLGPAPPEVCIVLLKSWASEGDDRSTVR